MMKRKRGKVYLVGAGPGDPGLLTLRGAECLRDADVVFYDYLAAPELLSHSQRGAELICLGRHGHGRLMSQTEICAAIVRHALNGRIVVRLKGGDPAIFARLAEELAALEAAGIPYEIVPGVTAASAASSHAGVPLTNRDEASCVAFVTGRECGDKADAVDYAALAAFPGTLVFYMGITTAPQWSRELVNHGKAAATPVAIVRRSSLPDQETILSTLGELPELLQRTKLRPPAVVIVGDVAREAREANWFNTRPLFGKTVLVTRPEHQAEDLADKLRAWARMCYARRRSRSARRPTGRRSMRSSNACPSSTGSYFPAATACISSCKNCSRVVTTHGGWAACNSRRSARQRSRPWPNFI